MLSGMIAENLDEEKKRLEIANLHVERKHAPWKLFALQMPSVTAFVAALLVFIATSQQLKEAKFEREERKKTERASLLIQISKIQGDINQTRRDVDILKDQWPEEPGIVRFAEEIEDNAYRNFFVTLSRLSSPTMGLTLGGSGGAAFVRIQLTASMLFGTNAADLTPSATVVLKQIENAMDHDVGSAHITMIDHVGAHGPVSGYARQSLVRDQTIAKKFLALSVKESQITAIVVDNQQPLVGKSGLKLSFVAERYEFVISGTLETNLQAIDGMPVDGMDRDDNAVQVEILGIQQNTASGLFAFSRTIRTVLIPLSTRSDLAVTTQNPSAAGLMAAPHYIPRALSPSAKPASLIPPMLY